MQAKNKLGNRLPLWFVIAAYAAISLSHTIAHDFLVDRRVREATHALHAQVMNDNAPAPIQYRVMIYYAADTLMKAGVPFEASYFILRFVSTFVAALAFHFFLSMYFAPLVSFAGVMCFLAALPVAYIRYFMQPMDLPNLFFFLLGFMLIVKRKDWWLLFLIIIAMLNRETAILLSLVYLFYRWDELPLPTVLLRSGLMFASGMGVYVLLQKAFHVKQNYADSFYLGFNLTEPWVYVYALSLFGPLLAFAFWRVKEKPKIFRRGLLLIPFFLVIHYTMAIMAEPRLWLPLLPIVIGGGLWALVPGELKIVPVNEAGKMLHPLVTRYCKASYIVLFGCFMAFFLAYYQYSKSVFFKNRSMQKRAEAFIAQSAQFARSGWHDDAAGELLKALTLDPKNSEAHYQLALIYDYNLHKPQLALEHFKKCLEENPYHLDRVRINDEIDRLTYYLNKQ